GLIDVFAGGKFRYLERDPTQQVSSFRFYRFGSAISTNYGGTAFESAGDLNGDGIMDLKVRVIVQDNFCWEGNPCQSGSAEVLYTVGIDGILRSYFPYDSDYGGLAGLGDIGHSTRGNFVADINGD